MTGSSTNSHPPVRTDPESGLKLFNTRAEKSSDRVEGTGYGVNHTEDWRRMPEFKKTLPTRITTTSEHILRCQGYRQQDLADQPNKMSLTSTTMVGSHIARCLNLYTISWAEIYWDSNQICLFYTSQIPRY